MRQPVPTVQVLKLFGKALLGLVGLVILYVGVAVVLSLIPTSPEPLIGARDHRVFVSSNGVHTDFILPVALVPRLLLDQLGYLSGYSYLAFGWGDKGFYLDTPTWAELKVSTAVRAMILPSPTAVHVSGYDAAGRDWALLEINDQQLAILNEYIAEAFRLNNGEVIIPIDDAGYGNNDEFYEGLGSYNALYTCNNWVNDGLQRMSVRTALWSPSEWGIMRWL